MWKDFSRRVIQLVDELVPEEEEETSEEEPLSSAPPGVPATTHKTSLSSSWPSPPTMTPTGDRPLRQTPPLQPTQSSGFVTPPVPVESDARQWKEKFSTPTFSRNSTDLEARKTPVVLQDQEKLSAFQAPTPESFFPRRNEELQQISGIVSSSLPVLPSKDLIPTSDQERKPGEVLHQSLQGACSDVFDPPARQSSDISDSRTGDSRLSPTKKHPAAVTSVGPQKVSADSLAKPSTLEENGTKNGGMRKADEPVQDDKHPNVKLLPPSLPSSSLSQTGKESLSAEKPSHLASTASQVTSTGLLENQQENHIPVIPAGQVPTEVHLNDSHSDALDALCLQLQNALNAASISLPPHRIDHNGLAGLTFFVNQCSIALVDLSKKYEYALEMEQEWSRTFEVGKEANLSLQEQLRDAWGVGGKLREELCLKEEQLHSLERIITEERLSSEELRGELARVRGLLDTQLEYANAKAGAVTLMGPTASIGEQRGVAGSPMERAGQSNGASTSQELLEVQEMVHIRGEELFSAQATIDHLQAALDRLRQERDQDVKMRTSSLEAENNALQEKLLAFSDLEAKQEREKKLIHQQHEEETQELRRELQVLHGKLAELRRQLNALSKTSEGGSTSPIPLGATVVFSSSNDTQALEDFVDKPLLSEVIAKYIHAFVEQRPEAPEMLKVLSGLLCWDVTMQERVGLLPGPLNPMTAPLKGSNSAVPQPSKGRRFLSGLARGFSGARETSLPPSSLLLSRGDRGRQQSVDVSYTSPNGEGQNAGRHGSLAAQWVDFLFQESQGNVSKVGPEVNELVPARLVPSTNVKINLNSSSVQKEASGINSVVECANTSTPVTPVRAAPWISPPKSSASLGLKNVQVANTPYGRDSPAPRRFSES